MPPQILILPPDFSSTIVKQSTSVKTVWNTVWDTEFLWRLYCVCSSKIQCCPPPRNQLWARIYNASVFSKIVMIIMTSTAKGIWIVPISDKPTTFIQRNFSKKTYFYTSKTTSFAPVPNRRRYGVSAISIVLNNQNDVFKAESMWAMVWLQSSGKCRWVVSPHFSLWCYSITRWI